MKKIKLLSILALSTVVLGACSALSKQSSEASSDNKEKTEQVEKKVFRLHLPTQYNGTKIFL